VECENRLTDAKFPGKIRMKKCSRKIFLSVITYENFNYLPKLVLNFIEERPKNG